MDVTARLEMLERRVKHLEDQVAIYQLMASYGPAADSGSTARAISLWAEDGVYDLHARVMTGRAAIARELEGTWHQGLIAQGSGHIVSMPHVVVEGDAAVATCHSRLYRREGDDYRVISCSANRWEFARGRHGWEVTRRVSRRLDGSPESHELLARGVQAQPTNNKI
ncbi:MAG: nuclear transport factor 2 family protein [Proteobacteria bacterium]|nr:MAG: nuclear transport factor 2 family protein [Pseudomonadota bacterium]